jgi:hypothetical protein
MRIRWPLLFVACVVEVQTADAAPSEREQQLLHLGSSLGAERLEILTWPDGGEIARLKVVPFDKDPAIKGRFRGYDTLASKSLSATQTAEIAAALLDLEVYDGLAIRRPEPPKPYGVGAGKMCGGFRPIVGLRLEDAEGRSLDVLLCFSCSEIAFTAVTKDAPGDLPTEPARHFSISPRGCARLLTYLAEAFPGDVVLRSLRDDKVKRLSETDRRPTRR